MDEKHIGPIWFIPGPNKGKYPHCHSVYIEGPGILIDPGADRGRMAQLKQEPGVKAVWLSHAHEDHFTHLDLFDGLPLWTSAADAGPLADIERFLDAYAMEGGMREFSRVFFEQHFHFRPRNPDRLLRDGEIIDLEGLNVEVIHTPGHTPGHLAFWFKEPNVLYMGDYDVTPFGPWYGDLYSSIEEVLASIDRLKSIPAKVWITAHEDGVFEEEPGERWRQYTDVIATRDEKLLAFLENPRTMDEIARAWIVYGRPREPEELYLFGERGIMAKHVERLLRQGRVAKDGELFLKV